MAEPITCPGCGEREGVRLVLGSPTPAAQPWTDSTCRACGAQWASGAAPSR